MKDDYLQAKLANILQKQVTLERHRTFDAAQLKQEIIHRVKAGHALDYVIHGELTQIERELVSFVVELASTSKKSHKSISSEEELARQTSLWIQEKLSKGVSSTNSAEEFEKIPTLQRDTVPILLSGVELQLSAISYSELLQLLKSFFEANVTLIPIDDVEWLILIDKSILAHGRGNEDELIEDTLADIAYGLHEMITNEWMRECQISVTYPISPSRSLLAAIEEMKEYIKIGQTFRFNQNIFLPWELRLERLLLTMAENEHNKFLKSIFSQVYNELDGEMLITLESFFYANCNVSDTAKKLYIHRNTLLYRLDKFKQETGMDVRVFDHAVLVKIALLLYRVTKKN
jgi:DNA-binding PucR family transcriptional regulator